MTIEMHQPFSQEGVVQGKREPAQGRGRLTWFLRTYCVSRVPPVAPILPPLPVPVSRVEPTSGRSRSAASLGLASRWRLLPRSSRNSGSACGVWMMSGACGVRTRSFNAMYKVTVITAAEAQKRSVARAWLVWVVGNHSLEDS